MSTNSPFTTDSQKSSFAFSSGNEQFSPVPTYSLGKNSISLTCPRCNNHDYTNVSFKSGNLTFCTSASCSVVSWLTMGCGIFFPWMLFITPCSILGACIPYYCNHIGKDVEHSCSNCNLLIGIYRRL